MKPRTILLAGALVAALAFALIYERRDGIARDLANSLLGDSGLTIVNVALDTVTGNRVAFDSLELALAGGTRIRIEDLEAPLAFPSLAPEYVSIARMTIDPAEGEASPTPLTPLARRYLELPSLFPATAVTISETFVPGIPTVRDFSWTTGDDFQRMNFVVSGHTITMETERADAVSHRVRLALTEPTGTPPIEADMAIIDRSGDIQLNAYAAINLADWLNTGRAMAVIPSSIDSLDGTLFAMAQVRLDSEEGGRIAFTLNFATDGEAGLETTFGDGVRVESRLPLNRPTEIRIAWPYAGWTMRSPESRWSADIEGISSLPLQLTDLNCNSDITCTFDAAVGPGTIDYAGVKIDRVMMTIPLELNADSSGNRARLEMSRDPSVFLTGITTDTATIGAISTLSVGNAFIELSDAGLQASLDSASIDFSTIASGDARLDALTLRLQNVTHNNGELSGEFRTPGSAGMLRMAPYTTRLPGVSGRIDWANDLLALDAMLEGDAQSVSGDIALRYRPDTGRGQLTMEQLQVDFGARSLRQQLTGIAVDADIVAGTATASGAIPFGSMVESTTNSADVIVNLDGIAARYEDLAATGIAGRLAILLNAPGPTLAASTLSADLVDVGIPLTQISTRFAQQSKRQIAVESFELALLGGAMSADPFTYDLDADTQHLFLRPAGLQLPFMAELAGFDSLDVEGTLNGVIPVTIAGSNISIAKGRLENQPPGGVIRFNAEAAAAAAGSENLDIASRALRNFRFDVLSSDVEYNEAGDLVLNMRLSGINPDMDPNQPIILNLNIENNIPQLLRSLQAVRSIEDILEKRSARQ